MHELLSEIHRLVAEGDFRISDHAMVELLADAIEPLDVVASLSDGELIESYPATTRGASILVLQTVGRDRIIHAVWGLGRRERARAVLITVYVPDPTRWSADFRRRLL